MTQVARGHGAHSPMRWAHVAVLECPSPAMRQGFEAFNGGGGFRVPRNPYRRGTRAYAEWQAGHDKAADLFQWELDHG